ncbi:hypothetical protein DEDE109153_09705 [Deinococcus deserti]
MPGVEGGSGKSVTSLSILRLIPMPPRTMVEGEMRFAGKSRTLTNLVSISEHGRRQIL